MDDLTELVEVTGDEPFVLHPGEFVLGQTLERVKLPDDLVARARGEARLGQARPRHPLDSRIRRPRLRGEPDARALRTSRTSRSPLLRGMPIGQISFMRWTAPSRTPMAAARRAASTRARTSRRRAGTTSTSTRRYHSASMPNIGLPEIIIVLVIALIIFGPKRLPELGNSLGRGIKEFRGSVVGREQGRRRLGRGQAGASSRRAGRQAADRGQAETVDGEVVTENKA